ncbi:MAG: arginine--tRNA ligase [Oscillospiraceae bacterium]|nr:arginine--tRNA ligase [Oscillospiraceae bacterium]
MKAMTATLTEVVSEAFEIEGYDPALGTVTASDRLDLCQFQCNGAFAAAKMYKKAPFIVAEQVAEVLRADGIFSKVEVAKPGFLNLTLTDEYMKELANAISADPNLGVPQAEKPSTIVLDYGGPNVAKPLHIGHLRSAIIGESIKHIARAAGHKVIGDIHLGDWGLQMGLVITELCERHPDWRCFAEDFDPETDPVERLDAATLNEVYPFASKRSKEDAEYADRAHQATVELQQGRPGYIALWHEIMRASIEDMKGNYEKLGVSFDLWYGESNADAYVPQLMDVLAEKDLLIESDGALVVEVAQPDDKAPMPPVIVRKSDHSSIYATTDLATIIQRQQDFAPDKIWYVVDNRQGLHFTQVFRCAKKAQLVPAETEFEFLGFGTMNGSDGKPYKTREGGVMKLEDMIATVTASAQEKLEKSNFVGEDDYETIARKVGVAAIKFGDLINQRAKDYVFDLGKFMSFEGKTGTYLLYTVTRINSILNKAGVSEEEISALRGVYTESERDLLLKIIMGGDIFNRALSEKAPNYLCENAYQLAIAFSKFYHDNRIIDEADEDKRLSWLALCLLTRKVLLKHLDLLGIEAVDHM